MVGLIRGLPRQGDRLPLTSDAREVPRRLTKTRRRAALLGGNAGVTPYAVASEIAAASEGVAGSSSQTHIFATTLVLW